MLSLRATTFSLLFSIFMAPAALAQATEAAAAVDPAAVVDLQTLVVSGVQPGPGMWKVSNGGNVLWVMGTLSPLPKRMEWLSRDVEAVVGQSQEVILPPGVSVTSGLGRFRSLLLVPSLLRARKNPDGLALEEVLPADLHARWTVLKLRHLGQGSKFESWRPVFASMKLYEAALDDAGLADRNVVAPVVESTARRHEVTMTRPMVTLRIADPKKAIREFSSASLGDVACFEKTVSRLETDLAMMVTRANAWSIGDLDALRSLPYEDQEGACLESLLHTELAREQGFADLRGRVQEEWIEVAENALKSNRVTFATLPVSELLEPDGYLGELAAKGYLVEQP